MRKTSVNNGSAHAHNLYYSSANGQDFLPMVLLMHKTSTTVLLMHKTSQFLNANMSAKYRHIPTQKSTTVSDCLSYRWHNHNIARTATAVLPAHISCTNDLIPTLMINNPKWT
jgi:hypothetical protein